MSKKGLGRGFESLIPVDVIDETFDPTAANDENVSELRYIKLGDISSNPDQPRHHFDEAALAELAQSITAFGVLQPIVVAPAKQGYVIVAGERRWRAAQRAGLHQIPALVRDLDDAATYEIALVENIQRQDLNAIEEAGAYRRLIDDFGHSQEALARLVGKSRSHVANLMRLLDLPQGVQALVSDGSLSMGHARALIGADDAETIARKVVKEGLSVRAVEALIRADKGGGRKAAAEPAAGSGRDPDIMAVERHLSELLGIGVAIQYAGGGNGALTLKFASLDQLDMICQRLSG